jgi:hypothetical protein
MLRIWMKALIVCLLVLILGAGLFLKFIGSVQESKMFTVHPQSLTQVNLNNPFMGMAPPALNGPYQHPHRLVYMVLTWNELESEKGKYDFTAIERKYKLNEWYQQGVKVIIRFVLDYSTDKIHKDIPDWLYEEIKRDGIWYDEEVGKGFSPNYDNAVLIKRHAEVIEALGNQYNKDPRVAFIALGSLGHWGEWHTFSNEKITIPFPKLATSDIYVEQYLKAFPDKRLLMRRPHAIAKENGIGLYNDVFGSVKGTSDFVDWFENGYLSALAGMVNMPAMPEFWKQAPSGGEFANADVVRGYFQNDVIAQVLQMVERSHVSWLGPSNPADLALNEAEQGNLNKLLNKMGYRFRVSSVSYPETAVQGGKAKIVLSIMNDGVAPFYYDWPLELSLMDEKGEIVARTAATGLVQHWLPGENSVALYINLPPQLIEGTYNLKLALLDPDTTKPGVDFAMDGRQPDGRYLLTSMLIRKQTYTERFRAWFAS